MKRIFALLLVCSIPLFAAPRLLPAAQPPAGAAGSAPPARQAVYDLNRVSFDELVSIKGIGPALAEKIIDLRSARGGFSSVDDLLQVRGIGEKSLAKLRVHFTLTAPPAPVATSQPRSNP